MPLPVLRLIVSGTLQGAYVFADYVDGTLKYATIKSDGSLKAVTEFDGNAGGVTSITFSPDGEIYTTTVDGFLFRYAHLGSDIATTTTTNSPVTQSPPPPPPNRAPKIVKAKARNPKGQAPHKVKFRGGATDDQDSESKLEFRWDFGDGETGTGRKPKHKYRKAGRYKARLTVTDRKGAETKSDKIVIKITDSSETTEATTTMDTKSTSSPAANDGLKVDAKISVPADGITVRGDQLVNFVGIAQARDTKAEVPAATLRWTIETGDGRVILDGYGKPAGSFVVPSKLDAEDASVLVSLEATHEGRVDTKRIQLLPMRETIAFAVDPARLEPAVKIRRGNINAPSPSTSSLVVGQKSTLEAPETVCTSNIMHQFVAWGVQFGGIPSGSEGFNIIKNTAKAKTRMSTPDVGATVTAQYAQVGKC